MAASLQKGLELLRLKRYPLAEEELRQFLTAEPDSFVAHAYLALALSHQKRTKESLQEADRSISLQPEHAYPHFVKATILGRIGKLPEALAGIQEAIRLDPNDADYFEFLSQVHFAKREWQNALQAAEKGLFLEPKNVACRNARTQALIKLNRHEEAGQTLAVSLSDSPDKADTHAKKGLLLLDQGKYDEAVAAFEESLRLDPMDREARQGLARALKARYPFYSWMLKYFLWTEKMGKGTRYALTVGIYLLLRGLLTLETENPRWEPFLLPVLGVYLVFLLALYLSDPLFNLVLCLTPAGRAVLSEEKVLQYKWFMGAIFLAILFAGLTVFTGNALFAVAAFGAIFFISPLLAVFHCPPGRYRLWLVYFAVFTAVCGTVDFVLALGKGGGDDLTFLVGMVYIAGVFLPHLLVHFARKRALRDLG